MRIPVHGAWCGTKVFPVKCRHCSQAVFLFTCNCGSKVFFEELGWPWLKHACPGYLIDTLGLTRQQVDSLVHQYAAEQNLTLPDIDEHFKEQVTKRKAYKAPIKRIEPCNGQNAKVIGTVRELIRDVNVFKKLNLPENSLGAREIYRIFPNEIIQITIHVDDIGTDEIESYTFLYSSENFLNHQINIGSVIRAELFHKSLSLLCDVWIGRSLQVI